MFNNNNNNSNKKKKKVVKKKKPLLIKLVYTTQVPDLSLKYSCLTFAELPLITVHFHKQQLLFLYHLIAC